MAREVRLELDVVLPEDTALTQALDDLRGRELPGLPGSWVARVALAPGTGQGHRPDRGGDEEEELAASYAATLEEGER